MKVLFVSGTYSNFYTIDDIVRRLYQRGHDVRLILGMEEKATIPDDALRRIGTDLPNLIVEPLKSRRFLRKFARILRETLNYIYVLNHEETRKWDAAKWFRFFPPFFWRVVSSPTGKQILKRPVVQRTLRAVERLIPVNAVIRSQIQHYAPDLLIVMPLINPDSRENEYVQAAQSLGVPVLYSMVSWDNISTKGTFHRIPDYSVVWNEPLADELNRLHGFSRERTFITGAPRFDILLDHTQGRTLSRAEFCRMAGVDENKDFILYVGSTFLVTSDHQKNNDESELIFAMADVLASDPRTRDVNLILRPHPTNATFLNKIRSAARPNLAVFPPKGELPDTEEKRSRFHNAIYHSFAVAGVNTTAFLEASALDKPCITIETRDSAETQMLPHFHHLTDAGFLDTARGAGQFVEVVSRLKSGQDARRDQRREFVRNFLRPCGIPAVQAYVELVEDLGHRSKGQ